jgi:hypothetical protein
VLATDTIVKYDTNERVNMCLIRLIAMLHNRFLAQLSNKETAYDPCMYRLLLFEYFEEIDEFWRNLVCFHVSRLSLTILPFRTDTDLNYT